MVIYALVAVLVLLVIFVILYFVRGRVGKKLSPLSAAGFMFVLSGVVFGDSRLIGYSLIGVGVLLAIVDMVLRWRK